MALSIPLLTTCVNTLRTDLHKELTGPPPDGSQNMPRWVFWLTYAGCYITGLRRVVFFDRRDDVYPDT